MTTAGTALFIAAGVAWSMFLAWLLRRVLSHWRERERLVPASLKDPAFQHPEDVRLQNTSTLLWHMQAGQEDADADFSASGQSVANLLVNSRLSVLTEAEGRLKKLRKQALGGNAIKREDLLWALGEAAKVAGPKDIQWLSEAAKRVVRSTPQEFQFPQYMALIDRMACQAIPMRFDKVVPLEQDLAFQPGVEIITIGFKTPCGLTDAVFVARPWIRPEPATPRGVLDEFRSWRLSMSLDSNEVLPERPIEEFLVDPDGFGYRERAFELPPLPSTVLKAGGFEPSPGQSKPFISSPDQVVPVPGLFGVGDQEIRLMLLKGKPLSCEIRIRAGLVAALYTTKARA
jgi:hypothetical protein